ncbi:MAG: HAD family phosphatase [Collinsella sp.]|nr:HAD family phosphatase [Collinsella sp.]
MCDRFPYDAVIFDMDGVIVDTEAFYTDQERQFSDELGLPVSDDEIIALVGQSHQTFQRTVVDWFSRVGKVYTGEEAEAIFRDWSALHPCDFRSIMSEGVHETIDELKRRGVRVALASSSPMESIQEVLAACGLTDAFEFLVSGKDFRESKPNPEIYLHTLERLGLPAERCCCIEDSLAGITAGKAAGLTVFAKREERFGFTQEDADAIIDRIPDILDVC